MSLVCKCPEMGVEFPKPVQTTGGIRLDVVRDFDELQYHAQEWNRLVKVMGSNPVMSHAWITSHLQTRLNPGDFWFCLLAFDDGRLVGAFPVITVPRRRPDGYARRKRCHRPADRDRPARHPHRPRL